MIRVAIAAASPTVRAGLGALLAGHSGFVVLETNARPGELADLADTVEADVVLLALEAGQPLPLPLALPPDGAGREPAIVVLGDEPADQWASRALRAGARGALPRTADGDQIAAAVTAAAAGLVVRAAETAGALPRPTLLPAAPPIQPLTAREIEVLGVLAEGLGNKAMALRLGISEHTIKTHVGSIYAKLGVSTRAEAIAIAARLGLIML